MKKSAKLIKGSKDISHPGRPHGLTVAHQDEVNADLLKILKSVQILAGQPKSSLCGRSRYLHRPAAVDIKIWYLVTVSTTRWINTLAQLALSRSVRAQVDAARPHLAATIVQQAITESS